MSKMGKVLSASHQCPDVAEKMDLNFKLSIPSPGGVGWDSHYRCIEVLSRLDRDKINSFLIENDYSYLTISMIDKEKIEEFLMIMVAFFTASKVSQKSDKPSISLISYI